MIDPTAGTTGLDATAGDPDRPEKTRVGLSYWMERVLEEVEAAALELSAARVHDLRVALRRCRSMGEGFMSIDPDKTWRGLQKDGRQLFRRLGKLRDLQVLIEWVGLLSQPEDAVSVAMLLHLGRSEQEQKRAALIALHDFNRQNWRGRITRLQARARSLPSGGAVFQLAALQAWDQAHRHHEVALRDRTPASWHRLRISVKQFRYTIENFLPALHAEWGSNLKNVQDCLGEAHDLFVFGQTAERLRVFPDPQTKERWRILLAAEHAKRIDHYREMMIGKQSLWRIWRNGLPPQSRLSSMSLKMVEKWAVLHGLDVARARRIRSLSLQIFNGLHTSGATDTKNRRAILHLAALLHDLGNVKGKKGSGSASRFLRKLPPLPGFTAESLHCAAMVILGHRGKFWTLEDEEYAAVSEAQRRIIMELSGILRLARVLALEGERIGPLRVKETGDSIQIFATGYARWGPLAEKVARARYVLEIARRCPVIVCGAPESTDVETGSSVGREPQAASHTPYRGYGRRASGSPPDGPRTT